MRGLSGDLFDSNWPQPVIANFAESLLLLLLRSYIRKAKNVGQVYFLDQEICAQTSCLSHLRMNKNWLQLVIANFGEILLLHSRH